MLLAISGTELNSSDSITKLINEAKKNEVGFVELWYPQNFEVEGVERTLELISEAGLKVTCISTGTELYRAGGSLEDQKLLMQAIELAHQSQAVFANTYFGYSNIQDDKRAMSEYQKYLKPCLSLAEELGITITLENEFDLFGVDTFQSDITRRPLSLLEMMEQVDSPNFKLTFDPCNYYYTGLEPFPLAYEILKPHIAYIQVKDGSCYSPKIHSQESSWKKYKDFDREYIMQPLGQGAINWFGFIYRLKEDGYDSFLSLEPHSQRSFLENSWLQSVNHLRIIFNQLSIEELKS